MDPEAFDFALMKFRHTDGAERAYSDPEQVEPA
jgi:hypothetical protein